jgi:chemotaxis protein CheD
MKYKIRPADYMLQPGYIYVTKSPALISTVLGSCVSVSIYDKKLKVGGMNHFRFPQPNTPEESTVLFGIFVIVQLVKLMKNLGCKRKNLNAQIFGGAYNNEVESEVNGIENIKIAEKMLSKIGIKILSKDTGGCLGRKIVFNTFTGEIFIGKVQNIRASDW